MTVSLDNVQRGTRIPGGSFALSSDWLRQYIEAVEDSAVASLGDFVSPMAVAAQSVGALLKSARLPAGAIHASEYLSWSRPFREGENLTADAIVASRGERQGWVLMFIDQKVTDDDGEIQLSGKASIVFPTRGGAAQSMVKPAGQFDHQITGLNQREGFAPVTKVLTQEKINRYAEVSGDHNPLHIDPAFAAATQFGGTIAHGMLVLAYISEMMTAAFGEAWLSRGGRLKVRFRGAARPGDTVTAAGRVVRVEGGKTACEVECRNQAGEVLISGEAEVRA